MVYSPALAGRGRPAWRGSDPGTWLLHQADGTTLPVQLRTHFLDPLPQVVVDGHTMPAARPPAWYHWLWSAFPLLLLILGGWVGGVVGAAAS
jgi:hypothetical protein